MNNFSLAKKIFAVGSSVAMALSGFAGFAATAHADVHAVGQNFNDNGTIYMILAGPCKAGYTSAGAFLSYGFNSWAGVVTGSAEDKALPMCNPSFIAPAPGTIIFSDRGADKGTGYFMSFNASGARLKLGFTSAAVFTGLGYSFANGSWADVSWMTSGPNIDNASMQHPAGSLVNDHGTIFFIGTSGKIGIPDVATFNTWGMSFNNTVPANAADMALSMSGVLAARQPGQLVPMVSGSPSPTPGPGAPLEGGVGDITVTAKSTYSAEKIGEGEKDQPVLAFEVKAGDDSDVALTAMKVELKQTNTADSRDITDYIDTVSIWQGSTKVGEADASDFSEDSHIFTKSITLNNAIVRMGDTETFKVAVTALSNLDSGDIDSDVFAADVLNVRFEDGDGVFTTEDTDGDALDRSFDFATFATTADVELKAALKEGADDVNLAHVIDVDDSNDTNNEPILDFTLEAAGDSDITVHSLAVNVDVVGPTNIDDMIRNITLVHGSDEFSSTSFGAAVGSDETYTFDDLEIDIASGDKEEFSVEVDFKSTADVDLDNGDTISAQLSGTEVDAIDAEDENGDDVSTANLTGTAIGEASVVYDAGIMTQFVSSSATRSSVADAAGEFDQGEFKVTFKVTSFDGDMRIDRSCEEGGADAAGQGVEYNISNPTMNSTTCVLASASTDTEDTVNTFEVDEGTTRTFTLTVNASITPSGGSDDQFDAVSLESINWGTATNDTNANYYTFDLGDYKTDTIFLNEF